MSASRYYRGADSARQGERDAFTALGVEMVTTSPPGAPLSVVARFGPVFRRLLNSMAPAVRALVDGGNAVIFDHVLHDEAMYESCLKGLRRARRVRDRRDLPHRDSRGARARARRSRVSAARAA